jgi:hypothetical protein
MLRSDAPEMQRLVDGIRAMLAFECPALREVEVQGRLQGMATTLYRGVAARQAGWRLETFESIRSEADGEDVEIDNTGSPAAASGLDIAGIDTGMTVDEARAAVRRAFGGEALYMETERLLTLEAAGCPSGYEPAADAVTPQPGWTCLRGWFSRDAQSRLSRFELIQVAEHGSIDDVLGVLEGRFGPAAVRWIESRDAGGLWGDKRDAVHLAWGDVVGTNVVAGGPPRPTYELEAAVERIEGMAVTTLKRSAGDAVPQNTSQVSPGRRISGSERSGNPGVFSPWISATAGRGSR